MLSIAKVKKDNFGKVTLLYGTVQDITARKQADQKIEKQQYYLTKAQEIGSIGTWELDLINNKPMRSMMINIISIRLIFIFYYLRV